MTKEDFASLQLDHQKSGQSLKSYLQQIGVGYSTYNYWRKKYCGSGSPSRELSPISFRSPGAPSFSFSGDVPSGATLLFPNGLRAHFGVGSEAVLMELLDKILSGHVLP